MKTSINGLNLIKSFEGCRLTAYRCPAGVPTIGYGHTKGVTMGMKITQAQADNYLREDVEKFERNVMKFDPIYHWNQNQFDALVSFAYNLGSINKLVNEGKRSIKEVSNAISSYNKAGGKVLAGLVRRRAAEKKLFDTPVSGGNSNKTEPTTPSAVDKNAVTATSNVFMRSQPNTSTGAKLTTIPKGKVVKVIEDTGWGWSKCEYGGKTGYVSNTYLSNKSSLSTKRTIKITGDVNMRSGPDSSKKNVLQVIKRGASFVVDGIHYNGSKIWMRTTIKRINGWICYNFSYCK